MESGRGRAAPIAVGILLKGSQILVARRKEGAHLAGSWEFPGGKVRPGEAVEAALRREVEEEVGVRFEKATLIHRRHHVYGDREVDLHFFLCTGVSGEPPGEEGQESRWVTVADLGHLPTPPANAEVIRMLRDQLA